MEKVSVIVPTFNRFKYLLNTISSIKQQTYTNLEIIVVNDCSIDDRYYKYNWEENGVIIMHLLENSKDIFGFPCAAYVRNKGIENTTGKYIAFCDDDDIWFPKKLELQINAMKKSKCQMSSTDGLIGGGIYDSKKKYKKYNAEQYFNQLNRIYKRRGSNLLDKGFPDIWTLDFMKIHNCMICSSVLMEKEILNKINNFRNLKPPGEDYDCWKRALKHTNSVYVKDVCFYYDNGHGDGRLY